MPTLAAARDFRSVQTMPFCYVCGEQFAHGARYSRDHIPARSVFAARDREPPLWLPTHRSCNEDRSRNDQLVGQLIGLRRYAIPSPRDRQLKIAVFGPQRGAVTNVDLDAIIWRWVRGFHAALYREYFPADLPRRALQTPLPRGRLVLGDPQIETLPAQHFAFVEVIKSNRIRSNLDSIVSNNRKLRYECVWAKFDSADVWLCIFALDLYEWRDLGLTPGQPARGCVGCYVLQSGRPPTVATRAVTGSIMVPNLDPYDPFAP
jgi:hypothetical protein